MRKWQFDSFCSSYDRVTIDPEFQIGFSQKLSKNYQFFIFYRYIMGSAVRYKFDSEQENLKISGIPPMQGFFIGTKIF